MNKFYLTQKHFSHFVSSICISILLLLTKISYASTIEHLIQNNHLAVDTKIQIGEEHIVGQPVVVSIEVATDRWFGTGTRIKPFKLANAVILAQSELAINGSKRVDGATWTTQTREITLYPTRHGEYQLPRIEVFISVNTEQDGIVEGTILTNTQNFTISLPAALQGIDNYIVSPVVTLEVSGTFDSNRGYAIGDAISQTITIKAENTPSMMIPPLSAPSLQGVSIYKKPPQLSDQSNRGTLIGTRIETNNYIFEQAGNYQINEQIIFWWNTSTQQLEQLHIPAQQWLVSGSVDKSTTMNILQGNINYKTLYVVVMIILLIVFVSIFFKRYAVRLKRFYQKISKQEQHHVKTSFIKAVKKQQYPQACQLLYQYHWLINRQHTLPENELISQLNQQGFDKVKSRKPQFTTAQAKQLLRDITSLKTQKPNSTLERNIKLNN